jgi:hypothetical protein
MRKHFWIGSLLAVFLSAVFVISAFSNADRADDITLLSPSACPNGGCAAGQRLNLSLNYAVSPVYPATNTQVCVYAPAGGWADNSTGWISDEGELTHTAYTAGETGSLCSTNSPSGYEFVTGAYAHLADTASSDELELALNISSATSTDGDILTHIYEANGSGVWVLTNELTPLSLSVAAHTNSVYVANTATGCANNSPCYVNSGDDLPDGLGTGLRDAVNAASAGDTLQILGDYTIKSESILVDQAVTLTGLQDAGLSYGGSTCSEPMLAVISGAAIQNLTLDGTCGSSHRTLIDIDSPSAVAIEHNTLINGNLGIHLQDNTGGAKIAFNTLENNTGYAVYKEGSGGDVSTYANNIIGNGGSYQVNCNNSGSADHNFWGANETATSNALYCSTSNGKQLGAAIETSIGTPGVSAEQVTVTGFKQYAFGGEIAYNHDGGSNFDLIIVNHGQGADENVPFFNTLGNSITPCSDFYDVFLAEGASPSILNLSIEYDTACESAIESTDYCGSGNQEDAPLWWYDPANNVTEYWDTTGQVPDGSGAGSAVGQVTTCNSTSNQISVEVDSSPGSHPNLVNDLHFTPFVVGLPNEGGVDLSQFTVTFDGSDNKVRWTTTAENNISGFHVLRSDTENGTYSRISSLISSIGDSKIGGIYYYTDGSIQFTRTYYYKLEVINKQGESVQFYGPKSVLTSTATPTSTMTRTPTKTRTPYPTRTSTPYYYRSPTSYYRRATATPLGGPTRVRTYGPTPTPSRTSATKPTYNPSQSGSSGYPSEGYPVGTQMPPDDSGYPPGSEGGYQVSTQGSSSEQGSSGEQGDNSSGDDRESGEQGSSQGGQPSQPGSQSIQWPFLVLGAISGVLILAGVSFLLIKTRFN